MSDKYAEIIDALHLRLGLEKGKSMYTRVIELYEICRDYHDKNISVAEFDAKLADWWNRGEV